jgi:hypothetical protein
MTVNTERKRVAEMSIYFELMISIRQSTDKTIVEAGSVTS